MEQIECCFNCKHWDCRVVFCTLHEQDTLPDRYCSQYDNIYILKTTEE